MKISGNQTAVKEMMNLLDPSFVPPFMCRCYGRPQSNTYAADQGLGRTHWCECKEQDYWFEAKIREYAHAYEIEYNGHTISKCVEIPESSDNLINGCVK